jgi:HSP20 family protein
MENFVNDFFGRNLFNWENYNLDYTPKTKIKENENDYTLSFELPGFKKEDININVEDNVLVISSVVEKDEFRSSFENRYSIPEDANIDNIQASMEDGILKIVIGKYKELPKTNIKRIDIK